MTKWRMAWQATDYWTWHRFVCSGENKTAQAGALSGHLQVYYFCSDQKRFLVYISVYKWPLYAINVTRLLLSVVLPAVFSKIKCMLIKYPYKNGSRMWFIDWIQYSSKFVLRNRLKKVRFVPLACMFVSYSRSHFSEWRSFKGLGITALISHTNCYGYTPMGIHAPVLILMHTCSLLMASEVK